MADFIKKNYEPEYTTDFIEVWNNRPWYSDKPSDKELAFYYFNKGKNSVGKKDNTCDSGLHLQHVSQQRELLLDFMTYVSPEAYATHSKAELADNYLSSNSG